MPTPALHTFLLTTDIQQYFFSAGVYVWDFLPRWGSLLAMSPLIVSVHG